MGEGHGGVNLEDNFSPYLLKRRRIGIQSGRHGDPPPFGDCVAIGRNAVIPAQAGIQVLKLFKFITDWMPAFAGMTNYDTLS